MHDHVKKVRRLRELPGGYWSLGMNPLAARFAETGTYNNETLTSAYLFTDGFDGLVEIFELFDSWETAVKFMEENGIESAVTKLRDAESTDSGMDEYPRLKPHDDIGLARIGFQD